ncbi:MAG TPA: iron-containing alcohol dehydrogenase [Chthoniobacterales bacterium]|nr:iron-containing alcohol dehydrogenase [Chthoniobacterales bacterium]
MIRTGNVPFEFATSGRIVFGLGILQRLGEYLSDFGRRILVVGGKDPSRRRPLVEQLDRLGIKQIEVEIAGEPTIDVIDRGVRLARSSYVTGVIGFGGGSVIDSAKAIAALTTNQGDIADYLEVIGKGKPLETRAVPLCAIPTTAGTGAEVTKNAVLGSPAHRVKVSLRSSILLPRVVLIDPETTVPVPPTVTVSTGLDTLTQLIEPYVSIRANPITDAFCLPGIPRVAQALPRAFRNGQDRTARSDMSLASLLSGMALANAGLGAVHGFAAPIGGMFDAPHGAICAALLPHVMEMNVRALRQRMPESEALRRYDTLGRLLSNKTDAAADDAVKRVRDLCRTLNVSNLGKFGIRADDIEVLVERAQQANSTKANPIALEADELAEILKAAL